MPRRLLRPSVAGAIAAATIVASLAITLLHREAEAAVAAGFIPARLSGVPLPADWLAVPAVLTPLSAAFVHFGPTHLLVAVVLLMLGGIAVERAQGWRRLLLIYVAGAYAAAAAHWVAGALGGDLLMPLIGATGAASALAGAAVLRGSGRARKIGPVPALAVQGLWLLAIWAVCNYGLGFVGREAGIPFPWAGNIGGFALGLAMARPSRERPRLRVVH